jgi:Skp family chaperone for outer membrane proteins
MSPTHSRTPRAAFRLDLLAVALLGAVLIGASWMRPQAAESAPSRIATIDLEKTYNSIDRYAATLAAIKSTGEGLEQQVKQSESTVKELEAELESFQTGSDAQAAAIQTLQAAVGEFRAVEQFARAKIEVERARALRETYIAIKDAARRLAEREGYDYIMLDDSLPEMDPASAQRTMQQISARRFIFASPKSEVTDQLIALMNEEWKAAKGG